jgi:hypothetical protein
LSANVAPDNDDIYDIYAENLSENVVSPTLCHRRIKVIKERIANHE